MKDVEKFLLDHSPDAVYWVLEDGSIAYVNRAACRALGYDRQELLRLTVFDIDPDIDPDWWRQHWRDAEKTEFVQFERLHRRRDGSTFPVEVFLRHVKYKGQYIHFSFVRDLTEYREAERSIRLANRRLHDALLAAPVPVMLHRADGRIEMINQEWTEITGYTQSEMPRIEDWATRGHGPDAGEALKAIARIFRSPGRMRGGEFRIRCKNGETRVWSFYATPLDDIRNPECMAISVAIDVTERHRDERRMRLAESVFESASEGIVVTDIDGNIERVNNAFTRITGYSEDEVVGQNPRILQSGRQSPAFYEAMWQQLNTEGRWQGELWNRRKNGEVYPEWLSMSAVRDRTGKLVNYAGVFTDLAQQKRYEADLQQLRRFDTLTGLPNHRLLRSMLEDTLASAQENNRNVVVLVVGLDRFRMINESFSYGTGDRVLITVAERLRNRLERGVEAARESGDQFVLFAVVDDPDEFIDSNALSLRQLTDEPIGVSRDRSINVQFTAGVSTFPEDARSADELIRNAETAMFNAKRTKRGSFARFTPDQTRSAYQRLVLESDLRRALERDELEFHLQPIVSVAHGNIIGAEALARWNHPERGPIPPAEFIPIAEETGLIETLTIRLIESACSSLTGTDRQIRDEFRLAVNISPPLLHRHGFLDRVLDILAETGMKRTGLELELTESKLMERAMEGTSELDELYKTGIRLSIDDFGTGFSSLAYLQEINAQTLKIDRRFVRDVGSNQSDARIAASIIAMAHALELQVIAEGVETQQQLDFLRAHDCDAFQGFLHSRPLPVAEFLQLMENA